MRRRISFCLVIFCSIAGAIFVATWFVLAPSHRITEENIRKIQAGMSVADVEAILGAPPGDYSTHAVRFTGSPLMGGIPICDWDLPAIAWTSNETKVVVTLNFERRICHVNHYSKDQFQDTPWWVTVCRWVGLE